MLETKPPRVLLVGNFLSVHRGTRFYCEDLAERLMQAGCLVTTTSRMNGRAARMLDTVRTAFKTRRNYDVAIVDVYSGYGFWLAAIQIAFLRALRKPVISVLHGGGLPEFSYKHKFAFKFVLKLCQTVVTPSLYLQSALKIFSNDIVRIPNAMNISAYKFLTRTSSVKRICWLRAFDTAYDPVLAVRAMAIVHTCHPNVSLTMVGPVKRQELLNETRRAILEKGLEKVVKISSPINKHEVPAFLECHDMFINTTRLESFGVAVMEAAASGMPVVTTSAGEIPYLWLDGVDALLVPVGDEKAMSNAIIRLLDDPILANRIAYSARKKAETFDWKAVIPQWLTILQNTIADSISPLPNDIKISNRR